MKSGVFILACLALLWTANSLSQNVNTDSLWTLFSSEKNTDSLRFSAIDQLIWEGFLFKNPDSALVLADAHYRFAKRKKHKKQMAFALNSKSIANKFLGNQLESIANIKSALAIHREIGHEKGIATCLLNLGNNYLDNSEFLFARKMYEQSLELQIKLKNQRTQALCLNNIGLTYFNLNDLTEARNKYDESIRIYRISGDTNQIFYPIHNLGELFLAEKKFKESERYFKEAVRICQLQNDKLNEAVALKGLTDTYFEMKNTKLSIATGTKALAILEELNAAIELKDLAESLYKAYIYERNFEKAVEMQNLSLKITEELQEEDVKKELLRQEFQFQYEKKRFQDSLQTQQKEKLNKQEFESKLSRQKYIIWLVVFVLLSVLVVVYILVKSNRFQKRTKREIVEKNALISSQNKSLNDSINYADILQRAILPSVKSIESGFDDSFVLFQPKDVVSGDFYWYQDFGDARVLAVADCTGHGVPGALMSMMGYEILNNVMSNPDVQSPAVALNTLNERIRSNLNKDESRSVRHDGMDISVLVYQPKINRVQISGAGNPIIQIRNREIIVHKLDRQGVGGIHKSGHSYDMVEIDLKSDDCFYLFTDGYQDQFGGKNGKKFMRKRMYDCLLEIHNLPFSDQRKHLLQTFLQWKGKEEQVDDVCIIGVKLSDNSSII
jgi:serine phosphatase RsbU (regulator of sigma subunit)